MKRLFLFGTIIMLIGVSAAAATIEVSQPTYLTANGDYDRNPSITRDGADYWLFYTKADQPSPAVRGDGGYDPDGDTYVVYYKTASTIGGLATAAETKLVLSETNRPANFDQRVVSATYFQGAIYAFVSSGQSGTDRGLYYYSYSGGSWSGPTTLIADATARGGHVNVTSDNSLVYLVWESSDGSSDCYTWDGTTLSAKRDISNGNMPRITVLAGTSALSKTFSPDGVNVLFVANIEDGTGDIEIFSAIASPNPLFTAHSTAIPGGGLYDPCIFNDGLNLYVISAPWVATDRQYLIQAEFDGLTSTWSDAKTISYGGYGATEWWDYWPCGYHDGTDAWVFFTTETDPAPVFNDGEIAVVKLDWDLANDHYFYIQNGVDQAADNDVVNVAAGTYTAVDRALAIIGKPLTLTGAGQTDDASGTVLDGGTYGAGQDATGLGNAWTRAIVVQANDVTIKNLRIKAYQGDQVSVGGYAIAARAESSWGVTAPPINNLVVEDVTFDDCYYGVRGLNLTDLLVQRTTYEVNLGDGSYGIYVNGSTGTIIRANTYDQSAIWVTDATRAVIGGPDPADGNVLTNVVYNGIWYGQQFAAGTSSEKGLIQNNSINAAVEGGIVVWNWPGETADSIRILENTISGVAGGSDEHGGISIYQGVFTNLEIAGNASTNNAGDQPGLLLSSNTLTSATIVENFFTGNPAPGIRLYNVTRGNVTILGNDISGNTSGLQMTAGTTTALNASGNWWGDNTPSGVAGAVSANVDYTPWLEDGTDTDGITPGFQGDFSGLWVDDDSPQSGTGGRIAEGMDLASGSTVHLAAGTYAETLNITKSDLSIIGVDRTTVTINPAGLATNNSGIYVANGVNNVTLQGFTLLGAAPGSVPRYGIKFGDGDGCVLQDVEVRNFYRTGVDALGASNLTFSNIVARDNGGNGLQTCDANGVTFTDITTLNNAWGGIGIFTYGQYTPIGTSGIVLTGANSFGETSADVGGLYLEEGNYADPGNPWPITYSTNITDGADVTVQLADFTHTLHGNSDNNNRYTRFYETLSDAQNAAAGAVSHILGGRYIMELAGINLYVPGYLGGIQAAIDAANPGDIIHVDPGTYVERLTVSKSLDLRGAQYGVDPTPAGARITPANESIVDITGLAVVNPNVAVEIPGGVTDVSIAGFTLAGSQTLHYADESVVRCWDDNISLRENIFEGYVGVLYKGADNLTVDLNRMVVNKTGVIVQPNPASGLSISDNLFSRGASPATDVSAMYLTGCSYSDVTGNTATGFDDSRGIAGSNLDHITVSGNTFTGNKDGISFWGATTFITIDDNVLDDNLRYGINLKGQDIVISNNEVNGNGDVGINIDYHVIPTERISVNNNTITGNVTYGLKAANVAETVNAENNYWGSINCPVVSAEISGDADFEPWCNDDFSQCDFTCDILDVWVDDDYCDGCANDGHIWQYDAFDVVQDGVDAVSAGGTVHVLAGTHPVATQITITKALHLLGVDAATTIIDGPGGTVTASCEGLVAIDGVAGDVTIENVTLQGAPEISWSIYLLVAKNIPASASVLVEKNILIGRDNTDAADGGVWIAEGDPASQVLIRNNDISKMYRGIVLERMLGPCTAELNDIHHLVPSVLGEDTFAAQGFYALTYDGDITQPQQVNLNTFRDYAGYDIIFQGGHAYISDGKFTDVTIRGNIVNAIGDGPEDAHVGIMLLNDPAADLNACGVHNVEISENSVTTGGSGSRGIVSRGQNTGVQVFGNTVADLGTGILIDGAGTPDVTVFQNQITGNSSMGLDNTTGISVSAEANWWGAYCGPYQATTNPGGQGNPVSDNVDFEPWCDEIFSKCDFTTAPPGEVWVDDDYTPGGANDGHYWCYDAFDNIADGIDAVDAGGTVYVGPGTYGESVVFALDFAKDGLTISGDAGDRPVITGGLRIQQSGTINGIALKNLYIKGLAAGANAVVDMDNGGTVNDFVMDNCVIDGENISGRSGFGGQNLSQSFTMTGTEITSVLGWAVMDIESGSGDGGTNLPLTVVTFAGNTVHNCNGSVALRGNAADRTDAINVYGNTFTDIGGNQSEPGEQWAAFEVNHADVAAIYDNTVDNVAEGQWGEGQAIQLWDIGTLDMHDNSLTNCFQGLFIFGGGGVYGGPYAMPAGSIYHNILSGNTEYNISVQPVAAPDPLNAEQNYWGAISCPAITSTIIGDVDFEPYCNSTLTKCDFTCVVTEVWVDDDWTGSTEGTEVDTDKYYGYNAFSTIGDALAVVAGSGLVHVLSGTYAEQVVVNKSLTITGEGLPVIEPPSGGLSGYTIPESGRTFYPILIAYGGTDDGSGNITGTETIQVAITGLVGDGNNSATASTALGFLFRNCQSSEVSGNQLYEFLPASGNPETYGIVVYGNSDILVDGNTVNDWTRLGIGLMGDNGGLADPTGTISGNTVVGEGPLPEGYWAQNGIQIGLGATGVISGNEVSDIAYIPTSWSASALNISMAGDGVQVLGNNVHDCEAAINTAYSSGLTISGNNTFTGNEFIMILGGADIVLDGNLLDGNDQAFYVGDAVNVTVTNNTFTGNGYAILCDGSASGLSVTGNAITGSTELGVYVGEYYGYEPTGVVIHGNDISGNAYGVANFTSIMTDAIGNWWGDPSGPTLGLAKAAGAATARPAPGYPCDMAGEPDAGAKPESGQPAVSATSAAGSGDPVSSNVDYSPWWGANYLGDAHSSPWVWYLDNSNNSTLQEAVDWMADGDGVNVLDGVYDDPVNIEDRADLTFTGESQANTIFHPASTLPWNVLSYGSSRQAGIRVVGSEGITFSNMTMDFDAVKANLVHGFLYWNSTGEISENLVQNLNVPDASGGYYEIMSYMRAPDYSVGNRAQIDVLNNTFLKTGRVGIVTHEYVNVLIEGNTFDKVDDDFGYGIELGSASTGIIRDNVFRNYDTWAATDHSSSAAIYVENSFTAGLGPIDKPVTIEDNEIYTCQYGIYVGNSFPGYAGDVDIDVTIARNTIQNNSTTGSEASGGIMLVDEGKDAGSSVTADIDSNLVENNGDRGLYVYTDGNGDISATVTWNTLAGHYLGMAVKDFATSSASSYALAVHHNTFDNNLNAEDDVAGGFWDNGTSAGNCWSDFETNPGYPSQYEVPGNAGTIDRYPTCYWQCDCSWFCDVNGDYNINPVDIVIMVNFVYRNFDSRIQWPSCPADNGDWNCDEQVNPVDIVFYVNFVYRGYGAGPCDPCESLTPTPESAGAVEETTPQPISVPVVRELSPFIGPKPVQ